jgi:class 3 adenylate cyclase
MSIDVRDRLSSVQAPTLVVHMKDSQFPGVQAASELAAAIPNARLAMVAGDTPAGAGGREGGRRHIVQAFLSDGAILDAPTPEPPAETAPATTAIILFLDIVDSTALTERMGDAAFRAKARDLDAALRRVIRAVGGSPVEGRVLGDGVMAVFTSAAQAIEAAVGCDAACAGTELRLHLGIHAGDVIHEGKDVYGGAVNVAARIAGEAAAGEILVSDVVRALARTSSAVVFEDRGERALKGVEEAQRLWAVRAST